MENWAPLASAENWDNVGLMCGDPDQEVHTIVIALDLTDEILDKASILPYPLVITHHPPIFKPLTSLTENNPASRLIYRAIRKNVSLYASHTNLDKAPNGVSQALAETLDLHDVKLLQPQCDQKKFITYAPSSHIDNIRNAIAETGGGHIGEYSNCSFSFNGSGTYIPLESAEPFEGRIGELSRVEEVRLEMTIPAILAGECVKAARSVHPYDEMAYELISLDNTGIQYGYGAVGFLSEPLNQEDFIEHVGKCLNTGLLATKATPRKIIQRVAVMGGSGKSLISSAVKAGADAYVSAELGHHASLDYQNDIFLIDAGHRSTELPVLSAIYKKFSEHPLFSDCQIIIENGENVLKTYNLLK